MISRHLMKMLFGLMGMAVFGLICLFLINLYEKDFKTPDQAQGASGGSLTVTTDVKTATKPCLYKRGTSC